MTGATALSTDPAAERLAAGSNRHSARMYLVRLDDQDRHLLTSSATLSGALFHSDLLAQEVHRQLARSGEGHSNFWLRLVVTDPAGHDVAWSATDGGPGHPLPAD